MLSKYFSEKSLKYIVLMVIFSALTLLGYLVILNTYGLDAFREWAFSNFFIIFFTLLAIKVLGIIWPPLPGGAFIIAAVPALGWFWTWVIDILGVLIGASLAYMTSSKYGMNFLSKVLTDDLIKRIETVKVKKKTETEFIFILTLMSGPIAEAVYYGSALLKVEYRHFIFGVLLANIAYSLPSLYIIENFLTGNAIVFSIVLMLLLISVFIIFRKRYFENE